MKHHSAPRSSTVIFMLRSNYLLPVSREMARYGTLKVLCHTDGQACIGTQVEWNALQWCISYDVLTALKALPTPGIGPACSCGQVDLTTACSFPQDRRHQQVWTEEKLIVNARTRLIPRKVEEQWAHRRSSFFMGQVHLLQDVWVQSLTKEEEVCEDRVGFLAEGPGLVWPATTYHGGIL